jgi:hypothetical protein
MRPGLLPPPLTPSAQSLFLLFAGKRFEAETPSAAVTHIAGRNLAAVDHNLATAARNPAAAARNRATLAWIRPSPSSRAASAVARREQQGNFDPVLLSPVLLPILLPSCAAAACFSTVACFAAAWHRLPFPDTLSRE